MAAGTASLGNSPNNWQSNAMCRRLRIRAWAPGSAHNRTCSALKMMIHRSTASRVGRRRSSATSPTGALHGAKCGRHGDALNFLKRESEGMGAQDVDATGSAMISEIVSRDREIFAMAREDVDAAMQHDPSAMSASDAVGLGISHDRAVSCGKHGGTPHKIAWATDRAYAKWALMQRHREGPLQPFCDYVHIMEQTRPTRPVFPRCLRGTAYSHHTVPGMGFLLPLAIGVDGFLGDTNYKTARCKGGTNNADERFSHTPIRSMLR